MGLLAYLIYVALCGLIVGALARLALPGRDPMSLGQTMLLGIAGSLLAGIVVYLVTGRTSNAGFILSVLVTTALVYFVRRRRGGSLTDPGLHERR